VTAVLAAGPGGGLGALLDGVSLLWVPATILALLAVWMVAGPSQVPLRRLERLWHRDSKKSGGCLLNLDNVVA
jgi:hypothetical protein